MHGAGLETPAGKRGARVKTPEEYAESLTEHAQQTALFMWAALKETKAVYPELANMFAIPNGGQRTQSNAANLKAEGVRSGVPDVFLAAARHGWFGLFIEMKKPPQPGKKPGVISDAQEKWSQRLRNAGYGVAFCDSFAQARAVVMEYLDGPCTIFGTTAANPAILPPAHFQAAPLAIT